MNMVGVMFVIDQLGQTVMAKDQQIAELTAENDQLQAQLAGKDSASAEKGASNGSTG